MYKAFLTRLEDDSHQTLGHLTLFDGLEKIFECVTLELPWKANMRNISCIPKGVYKCKHRSSEKYKNHIILQDVPNRRYILIHYGNYNTDTRGCILVGSRFGKINRDSLLDITASRRTLNELLESTEAEGFELNIS
tara:strand:+ start:1366 stop:1773 length:408 start_codon:yes stop_codon:yes gene_type:complete